MIKKRVGFVVLWLGAATVAVLVSWQGVSIVNNEVLAAPPVALAINNENDSSASSSTSQTSAAPQTVTLPAVTGPVTTAEPQTQRTSPTSPPPTAAAVTAPPSTAAPVTSPPPTAAPPTSPPPATPTSPPPTTPTSPPPTTPTSPPPTTPSAAAQVLTFNLVGGSTAISFSPSGATVVWANPKAGYSAKTEPESPGIKVEFRGESGRSRIDAWWDNGPQTRIREED